MRPLYRLLNSDPADERAWDNLKIPPPVPTTSIYSRSDGIVAWQSSVQAWGANGEYRGGGEPHRFGRQPGRAVCRG